MQSTPEAGASLPTPSPSPAAATASEVVHRPEPGLSRGVWEASPAFFWVVLGAAAAGSFGVLLYRTRARRRKTNTP